MIYTLTINPSLDYIMEMDEFSVGKMNRSRSTYLLPGGKGINVSQVLTNLGAENVAFLPVAGFTGEKLLNMLSKRGMAYDAVFLKEGNTRINVKILCQAETELNADGPALSEEEKRALTDKIKQLKKGDYLILSGSVQKCLGGQFYADIMRCIAGKGINVVLDTVGENFINALKQKPFLVKPNKEELEELFHKKANTDEELLKLAKRVQTMGAGNVLVSKGGDGALFVTGDGRVLTVKAPKGKVVNSVGSGDSMVAGFVYGYEKNQDMETALKWGIAAGSAGAFSKNLATKEEIDALFENL